MTATDQTTPPSNEQQVQEPSPKAHKEESEKTSTGKRPVTKEKLRSIMEAASALTALGDEDEENGSEGGGRKEGGNAGSKRYIPEHKKPDAALTFPEKLMSMMKLADKHDPKEYCIAWLADGKSFVIRNPDEFTKQVLPDFFKATKFSSFTRKLYRWGFRQVNRGIGPDDPIIFGNEYFQRDNAELMVKMRSVTAAGTRKCQTMEAAQHEIEAHHRGHNSNKRPLDVVGAMDEQRKRMFLEQMLAQQQGFGMPQMQQQQQQEQACFMQPQGFGQSLNLATALRPGMGGMPMNQQMYKHMNQPSFNQDHLNLYMAQQQLHQQQQLQQHQQQSLPQHMHLPVPEPQQQMGMQQGGQSYNQASTAEIVNAAINALRYAS